MSRKSEIDQPLRLPIKVDRCSNGEYVPPPLSAAVERARDTAVAAAVAAAQRVGVDRRRFLASSCGAAAGLLALNQVGCGGGRYRVPEEARHEPAAADEALGGDEFIFDVQTHHVSADRPWYATDEPNLGMFLETTPAVQCGADHWSKCFDRDAFIKEVFLDSDTDLGVLSALWGSPDINAINAEEAALTRRRMAQMEGAPRLRIHGIALPQAYGTAQAREHMQALVEEWQVAAWKLYPVWGPNGTGYRMDDAETGLAVVQMGLDLGVPLFAIHKGLPLPGMDPSYTRPDDIGPMARQYPQATFLIYHSGYEPDQKEGPYDPQASKGVDVLIRSCKENGIGPDGNVYAELGSLWREVMKDPDEAAHALGKLLAHFGPERILWGTDAIWYGSPQDQIQAFRTFEISAELQEKHGYPALTTETKRKIFGLNGARVYGVDVDEAKAAMKWDPVARARALYQHAPAPSLRTYGPRNRRELLRSIALNHGLPG